MAQWKHRLIGVTETTADFTSNVSTTRRQVRKFGTTIKVGAAFSDTIRYSITPLAALARTVLLPRGNNRVIASTESFATAATDGIRAALSTSHFRTACTRSISLGARSDCFSLLIQERRSHLPIRGEMSWIESADWSASARTKHFTFCGTKTPRRPPSPGCIGRNPEIGRATSE